jgi:hypothetical protein
MRGVFCLYLILRPAKGEAAAFSTSDSTVIRPPCCSISFLTMVSPIPVLSVLSFGEAFETLRIFFHDILC